MKIPGIVILAHIFIIAGLLYLHPPKPKHTPHRPVAVHTYILQEEKPKPVTQTQSVEKSKPVAEVEPVVQQKKPVVEKPKPVAKKPVATTQQQKQSDPNREKLVQMMQESLASLDTKPVASKIEATKQIGTLASEALTFEAGYQEQLVAFMEHALTLPEKGDVKIALTVSRKGVVESISVKQAGSERNRAYVESTVPTLLLPPFDTHFKGESRHSFSITLTSS